MNHQPDQQPDPILAGIAVTTTDRRRAAEFLQSAPALDGNADRVVLVKLVEVGANRTMAVMPSFPIQMTALLIAVMREAFNLSSRSPSWPTRPKHCAGAVFSPFRRARAAPRPPGTGSQSLAVARQEPPPVGAIFADRSYVT